ncbi:uncharacterized protein LOC106652713 [Trichogramma pretiosum]|uniref:uncharacterized protein LOC106652713 n=1 Tax=Trichogramma pretiosum TaxID=7493 RepID=UPI000C719083|nr:uncharacterized protein LOC106652713 [Trichogramma pretiosum]
MSLFDDDDEYLHRFRDIKNDLEEVIGDARLNKFCEVLELWSKCEENEEELLTRVVTDLMNCTSLFPSVKNKEYFLQFALEQRDLKMIKLIEANELKIHDVRFIDGMSALHYLAEVVYGINNSTSDPRGKVLEVMEYFLKNPRENLSDDYGYTYLHAACMSGNVTAVNLLLRQGVDVNLDSYKYSALHIAVQYRREKIVEILLKHGADPNKQDVEKSTPLHALAKLCLCECTNASRFCDYRRPVDTIVQMLVDHGAILETRNRDGNSPLDLAVSRFDVQLVKSLLAYGASLDNLNEDKMFSAEFTLIELKNYPLTLNIIEMVQLLQSADYRMSLHTRFKMIKCFEAVRGDDTYHLIPEYTRPTEDLTALYPIVYNYFIHLKLILVPSQEIDDFFEEQVKKIRKQYYTIGGRLINMISRDIQLVWNSEAEKLKDIMLSDDISLYEFCSDKDLDESVEILKNIKNWRVPPLVDLSHTWINIIIKRHIANIYVRLQLELFAADLFMTDYCKLNLPYTACRLVAEHMDYEELVQFYKHTKDKDKRFLGDIPT